MELDQVGLLGRRPLALLDAHLQVVVVALSALLAVAPSDSKLLLHDAGGLAPLLDFPHLNDLLQDFVFLNKQKIYLSLPNFSLAHVLL